MVVYNNEFLIYETKQTQQNILMQNSTPVATALSTSTYQPPKTKTALKQKNRSNDSVTL